MEVNTIGDRQAVTYRLLWVCLLFVTAFLTWSFRHQPVTVTNRQIKLPQVGCSLWLPQRVVWKPEKVLGDEILGHISLMQDNERIGMIQRWSIADLPGFLSQSRDLAYGSFLSYQQRTIRQGGTDGYRLSYAQTSPNGSITWGEEVWLWEEPSSERLRVVIQQHTADKPSPEWYTQTAAILDSVRLWSAKNPNPSL